MLEKSARRSGLPGHRGRPGGVGAGLLTLALAAAGCSADEQRTAAPSASPTPLAQLEAGEMQVPRIEFCELVPPAAIADALGAKPEDSSSYGNGDEQDLPGVGTEVVQEIGCTWQTGATTARAWVFARPVDATLARTVVRAAGREEGCRAERGTAYGSPSLTQTCEDTDGVRRVRHAGLFGQTWLTCELESTDPLAGVRTRAETWCVQVANALDTSG